MILVYSRKYYETELELSGLILQKIVTLRWSAAQPRESSEARLDGAPARAQWGSGRIFEKSYFKLQTHSLLCIAGAYSCLGALLRERPVTINPLILVSSCVLTPLP
jgi:hypothetical protein